MVYLVQSDLSFFQSEDLLVILDTSGALVVYSGTTKVGNFDTSTMDGFDDLQWNYSGPVH